MKDVTRRFHRRVAFCGKDVIMFRPGRENDLSRAGFQTITTKYDRPCYETVRKELLEARDSKNLCNESSNVNA